MKKRLLFLAAALALCLGLAAPALAGDAGAPQKPTVVGGGSGFSGVIDENGSLWMWGFNLKGALGNGGGGNAKDISSFPCQTVPVKVLDNVVSVSCGESHAAAVKSDGSLWMWGNNYNGALGSGVGRQYVMTPVNVLNNVAAVCCGRDYTAAIGKDGSLWMWGKNGYGQLGNGTTTDSLTPIKIMDGVAAVSCGSWGHTAAIKTDGSLWTWGWNSMGALGNGTQTNSTVPVKVMDGVASVSCGYLSTAAVTTDGALYAWGDNETGNLGLGFRDNRPSTTPQWVTDGVASVSCGSGFMAAVMTDGSLYTCGDNGMGQLGNGYTGNASFSIQGPNYMHPVQTAPLKIMDGVAAVSCGTSHTLVVKTDGSVWAFGRNSSGELGNNGVGDRTDVYGFVMQTVPSQVSGLTARH